jgi:prepilin-type processing-associated H-X9-DG protein
MALPIAPPSSRWSMADVVVLAGVCLVAAVLFFPVIVNSRYASQIAVCQNNLRQLGSGLTGYSEDFGDGLFPGVPLSGRRSFAGIYAPILLEAGYITDPRVVVCPAIVEQVALRGFRIPSLAEIDGADDRSIGAMRERAGADYYAYNLGVVIGGQYRAPRNQQRPYFAMMADMPASYLDPQPSRNHGERGFNILFEDGHVAYVTTTDWPARTDDPLRNRQGLPEAGLDENDAVIGRSSSPPFRFVASRTPGSP